MRKTGADNFVDQASRRSLIAFYGLAGGAACMVSSFNAMSGGFRFLNLMSILSALTFIGLTGLIKHVGDYKKVARAGAVIGFSILSWVALDVGTLVSSALISLLLLILTHTFALGTRAGGILTAGTVCIFVIVWAHGDYSQLGGIFENWGEADWLIVTITWSLVAMLIYLCTSIYYAEMNKVVRQLEAASEKAHLSALLDPLTGLPNRLSVKAYLNEKLDLANEHDLQVAVAHIDFDYFKEINDKYGHPAGDFMLIEVAKRMKKWGKSCNFVARIGGDEFLAVLTSDKNPNMIEESLENLLDLISKPMDFEGISLLSSASIGAAIYPIHSKDRNELIVCADLALYEAKHNGRGRIRFFNKQMLEALKSRKSLKAELVTAMNEGQISPYFQPQVNISTNEIMGVEALIRWRHEKRGFISPAEFLDVAENSGLMVKLGRHVMEKAIREAAKWHALNIPFGRLALNASASELYEDDFVEWVLATAEKYDLPLVRLTIEIVETVMIKDMSLKLGNKLARIRQAGIRIELDDFGTGYASLQQLNPDEIDGLKIDRSFIKNMQNEPFNAAIIGAIVELAKTLNIAVVAEGAETFEELEALLGLGCHVVQGFGIARPMPAKIISDWMDVFQPKIAARIDENASVKTIIGSNPLRFIS